MLDVDRVQRCNGVEERLLWAGAAVEDIDVLKAKDIAVVGRKRERRFMSSFVMTMRATGFLDLGVDGGRTAHRDGSAHAALLTGPIAPDNLQGPDSSICMGTKISFLGLRQHLGHCDSYTLKVLDPGDCQVHVQGVVQKIHFVHSYRHFLYHPFQGMETGCHSSSHETRAPARS